VSLEDIVEGGEWGAGGVAWGWDLEKVIEAELR